MNAPVPGLAIAAPAAATTALPPEGEPFVPAGQLERSEPPGPDPAEGGGIHAAALTPPAVDQRNKVYFLS